MGSWSLWIFPYGPELSPTKLPNRLPNFTGPTPWFSHKHIFSPSLLSICSDFSKPHKWQNCDLFQHLNICACLHTVHCYYRSPTRLPSARCKFKQFIHLNIFLYLSAKSLEIIGSCFVFTKVSKSIVDKVIKPGRDSRDNMGWVEAQLKGEPQPASGNCLLSIHQSRVSQPWHYWHWAVHNPLLHILCCTLIVGCLAATLHSIHYMPAVLFEFSQPKLFLGIAKCPLRGKTFHAPSLTALNRCPLSSKGNMERNKG